MEITKLFFYSLLFYSLVNGVTYAGCSNILEEVNAADACTKIKTFRSNNVSKSPILLIAIHGDSPFRNPSYQYAFAKILASKSNNTIAIGLLRPGYTDSLGRTSDGNKGDAVGDNYDRTRVTQIAAAIKELKLHYKPAKTVLAGHSGGAAITANLIALYPELIDHAVMVSCPCNVKKWRNDMFAFTKEPIFNTDIPTLSPSDLVSSVSRNTKISIFTGSDDRITRSYLSSEYQFLLKEEDVVTSLRIIEGDHEIFLKDEVINSIASLIDNHNSQLTLTKHKNN